MAKQHDIHALLPFILRPVIRFCIRHSLHIQDFIDASKRIFVEEAHRVLSETEEKVNVSRLSALTGLQRRDVIRISDGEELEDRAQGLVNRVVGAWENGKNFSNRSGRARPLSCSGHKNEFRKLCESISTDLNPGTVLFELERLGVVERKGSNVRLRSVVYVPKKGDLKKNFTLLSRDLDDLIGAVEGNILESGGPKHLHGKTEYDNVPASALPKIRQWFFEEGARFHARAREFLARHDRDIRQTEGPDRGKRHRVAIATFSLID